MFFLKKSIMTDTSEFVKCVETYLDENNLVIVKNLFKEKTNKEAIQSNCWDLIHIVCCHYHQSEPTWQELINILAEETNPEEALLQFLEEVEECEDNNKFVCLLSPLQTVLLKIQPKRVNSIAWGLNAISTYLNKINSTHVYEQLLLYNILLNNFYADLVQKTAERKCEEFYVERCQILCKYLIQLLANQFCENSDISNRIIELIFTIESNPVKYLEIKRDDYVNPPAKDLGILFYHLYVLETEVVLIPRVYCPIYLFQSSIYLITALLSCNETVVVDKGIKLASVFLKFTYNLRLSHFLLENNDHKLFCKILEKQIVYNESENIRKQTLKVYETYLNSFNNKGIYLLVFNLFTNLTHNGLIGHTINIYKNRIVNELKSNEQNLSNYLIGDKLLILLNKFTVLPESQNVVEFNDQIMSTLNLLFFLLLRDKKNVTKIWNYYGLVVEPYLKNLEDSIKFSRNIFTNKIKEIESGVLDEQLNVTVGDEQLPEMTCDNKIEKIRYCLNMLDIVEDLMLRLQQCVEMK